MSAEEKQGKILQSRAAERERITRAVRNRIAVMVSVGRVRRQLTKTDLAEAAGVPIRAVGALERGSEGGGVSLTQALSILGVLGMTLEVKEVKK